MPPVTDRDLGVDVLIIGGGIQALYLARSLHPRYSVCLVVDPDRTSESLDAPGRFTAGYDGNDVARIQPARRSAGYWRLWAEKNGVEHDLAPGRYVLDPEVEADRLRLWTEATLVTRPVGALPGPLVGGTLRDDHVWETPDDIVMNPATVVARMGEELEDRVVWGGVTKFGLITDRDIEFVEVQTADGSLVPVTPRYVVLADDVHNGALLQRLAASFKDRVKRRDATEAMRSCQAVRRRTTIVVRGDLEPVAGVFDGIEIVSHRFDDEVVWLVTPPIDDTRTVLGPEDARFPPPLDTALVRTAVDALVAMSPAVGHHVRELRWGVFTARKTEHPMMAVPDTSSLAQPAPARLESLDMDSFVAVWPSHLGYAMIVGDVVAERIDQALGSPGSFGDGLQPRDLGTRSFTPLARWERTDFEWGNWAAFAAANGLRAG